MQGLFTQALGVNSPWFIKDIDFNNKQLNIHIDFKKGSKFVDNSDAAAKAYTAYETKMKKYRHMHFFEHECYLHVRVPRIKRDDGAVRMLLPPWLGKLNDFSLLFEAMRMRETFQQIYQAKTMHDFKQLLTQWHPG